LDETLHFVNTLMSARGSQGPESTKHARSSKTSKGEPSSEDGKTRKHIENKNRRRNRLYAREDDRVNCTFRPRTRRDPANETASRGANDDRANDTKDDVIGRCIAAAKNREKELERKRNERDYALVQDKKRCPECGRVQSFDEVDQKRKRCPVCSVEYKPGKVWAAVARQFLRRVDDDIKGREVRRKDLLTHVTLSETSKLGHDATSGRDPLDEWDDGSDWETRSGSADETCFETRFEHDEYDAAEDFDGFYMSDMGNHKSSRHQSKSNRNGYDLQPQSGGVPLQESFASFNICATTKGRGNYCRASRSGKIHQDFYTRMSLDQEKRLSKLQRATEEIEAKMKRENPGKPTLRRSELFGDLEFKPFEERMNDDIKYRHARSQEFDRITNLDQDGGPSLVLVPPPQTIVPNNILGSDF